jgi:hypothetical protein
LKPKYSVTQLPSLPVSIFNFIFDEVYGAGKNIGVKLPFHIDYISPINPPPSLKLIIMKALMPKLFVQETCA